MTRGLHAGEYLKGDFHNHTTFTDGACSVQTLIDSSMKFDLDWIVQSGHGGAFSRDGRMDDFSGNCMDDGNSVAWQDTIGADRIKGDDAGPGRCMAKKMWRWQSIQEFSYPAVNAKAKEYGKPVIQGLEWNVPGHEHCSMSIIDGQFGRDNADALAQFEYLFDASDNDSSEGDGQNWVGKLKNVSDGPGTGIEMHGKAVESAKWLQERYPKTSYLIFAHIERKGRFNPDKAKGTGYNIEHFRDFNNAAPDVAFGFEGAPGHQAEGDRGGFEDGSFGGGTYGGVGYYSAKVGHLWDALLGEGRNWWFFASSDYHSRGDFTPGAIESTGDFWPGEYQKNHVYIQNPQEVTAQNIVDAIRSGNVFVTFGDLIDALEFTAESGGRTATMGQRLEVKPGEEIKIAIRLRDPEEKNFCPYSFDNPSLTQVGISQSLNKPVLDHVDLISGQVTGIQPPDGSGYSDPENPTAGILKRFDRPDKTDEDGYITFTYTYTAEKSQNRYFRLRGTNLPPGTPNETDDNGNPLVDTLAAKIPCPECPEHVGKFVNYDVEAWADLWFMSNPVFIMVK